MPNESLFNLTDKLDKSNEEVKMESKSLQTGESVRNTLIDDDQVSF